MAELSGRTIGSYTLEVEQGGTAGGRTFVARHTRLGRPVALTLLSPRLLAVDGARERVQDALRQAAAVRHPHLAELLDVGEEQALLFVVRELVPDGSLRTLLQQRQGQQESWPLALGLRLVQQAASAAGAAHRAGLAHGDVRPDTVLLQATGADDRPYAAKVTGLGQAALSYNPPLGMPAYLSPEQTRGDQPTPASDVYALGVLLYEVATGMVPFAARSLEEAATKHGSAAPVPPRQLRQNLPADLETLILACLAKEPGQRPADGNAVAVALDGIIGGLTPARTVALAAPPTTLIPQTGATPAADTSAPTVVGDAAPPRPQVPAATIVVQDAHGSELRRLPLTAAGLTIGRQPENDLPLDAEAVSRRHARIDWDGQQARVTDIGSSNGTFFGDRRLSASTPQLWPAGALLHVGPFRLRLMLPRDSNAPTVAAPTRSNAPTVAAPDPLLAGLLGQQTPPPAPAYTPPPPAAPARPAGPEPRLTIDLDDDLVRVMPGQPATVGMIVHNQSDQVDDVLLSIEGFSSAWVRMPDRAVRLEPGARRGINLTLLVPRSPESVAGEYAVTVRARSTISPPAAASATWEVEPYVDTSIALMPRRVVGRSRARFQASMRNDGNATVGYLLTGEDERQDLDYEFDPPEVTLEPGESADVLVQVYGPSRLFGSEITYGFAVNAATTGEPPARATAQFVSRAALPAWLPVLLLLLVLGGVGFLLSDTLFSGSAGAPTATPTVLPTREPTPTPEPGAPLVNTFTIEPRVVAPGGTVLVRWNVADADVVQIEQFGDVPPQGEREYRIDQTTNFRLTATRGDKTTTRIEQIVVEQPTAAPTGTAAPTATAAPSATAVATAAPSATAAPTATAAPSATAAPTATPVAAAGAGTLLSAAEDAEWITSAGPLEFGEPPAAPDAGTVFRATDVTLEGGRTYTETLAMFLPDAPNSYLEGTFANISPRRGQSLLAEIGFVQSASGERARLTVLFDGRKIDEQDLLPDGKLDEVEIPLDDVAGATGDLVIRIERLGSTTPTQLFWINPRIGSTLN